MSERVIVADSGPLIALSRIGQLELLPQLFGRVQIPTAVFREVTQGAAEGRSGAAEVRAAPWIDVVSADEVTSSAYALLVDEGEAEAITVARAADALRLPAVDRRCASDPSLREAFDERPYLREEPSALREHEDGRVIGRGLRVVWIDRGRVHAPG